MNTQDLERDLAELDCIARRLAGTHGLGAGLLIQQAARMLRRELAEG